MSIMCDMVPEEIVCEKTRDKQMDKITLIVAPQLHTLITE